MAGYIKDNFRKSILGGGLSGQSNVLVGGGGGGPYKSSGMDGGNGRSMSRRILREAFGNNVITSDGIPKPDINKINNEINYLINQPTGNLDNNTPYLNNISEIYLKKYVSLTNNTNGMLTPLYALSNLLSNLIVVLNIALTDNSFNSNSKNKLNFDLSNQIQSLQDLDNEFDLMYIVIYEYLMFLSPNVSPLVGNYSLGPFRRAMNAGDINSVKNEAVNHIYGRASNQVNSINPGVSHQSVAGNKSAAGSVKNNGSAAYSGNPKYVYDGGDYVRFKKLQAQNRNYNDKSYGGSNNGAYVARYRVIH